MTDWNLFKIKDIRISNSEREFLMLFNKKWCNSCKRAREYGDFLKWQGFCKECMAHYRKIWPSTTKPHRKESDYIKLTENIKNNIASCTNLDNFKVVGGKISKIEKNFLRNNGRSWCGSCKTALELDKFHISQQMTCKKCKEKHCSSYKKRSKERNNFKLRELRKNNSYIHKKKAREYVRHRRKTDTNYNFAKKIRDMLYRISIPRKNKRNSRSICYTGTKSINEFMSIMSSKTNNPNWMNEQYDLDHLYQIHWFIDVNEQNQEQLLSIINSHENLRPLKHKENLTRDRMDFSPLKVEDFIKYEPYLKDEIKVKIKQHFGI